MFPEPPEDGLSSLAPPPDPPLPPVGPPPPGVGPPPPLPPPADVTVEKVETLPLLLEKLLLKL